MNLFSLRRKPAMRAFDLACRQPWAITEDALSTILEIAARENPSIEAVEAELGRPLDNTHTVSVRDGIASIPVTGPLFRYADLFTQISGATSYETLATDLTAALANPTVSAIVLNIDSPGGEANGCSELADMIANARGSMPIVAYIGGTGASAAYWLASACDEIVVADTAIAGSIGVVAAVPAKSGTAKEIEFVSSQSPNKRPDPATERGRAQIQGMIDDLAAIFVDAVARNRGVDAETVLRDFGQGSVFVGQKAVDAGLADRVGSYETVLASLAAQTRSTAHLHAEDDVLGAALTDAMQGETATIVLDTTPDSVTPTEALAPPTHPTEESMNDQTPGSATTETPATASVSLEAFEALQSQMTQLLAERDEAQASANAEAARAAALETESRRRELAACASAWHGETERHVSLLESLSDEHRAFYTQTMNALSEQVKSGALFEAIGVTGNETGGTAVDQLETRAKAMAQEQGIPYTDALTRVVGEDPSLYTAYRKTIGARAE